MKSKIKRRDLPLLIPFGKSSYFFTVLETVPLPLFILRRLMRFPLLQKTEKPLRFSVLLRSFSSSFVFHPFLEFSVHFPKKVFPKPSKTRSRRCLFRKIKNRTFFEKGFFPFIPSRVFIKKKLFSFNGN